MLTPGRTRVDADELPPGAEGATVRDVAWIDAEGRATTDRARVEQVIVDFRTDDGTPVLTAYGAPPAE